MIVELNRVLAPTWIVRGVRLGGVAQDEHLTRAIGKGTADRRARLKVVLAGRLEATVGGRAFDLRAGDVLLLPCLADVLTRGGDDEVLEIDWDDGSPIALRSVTSIEHGTLDGEALEAAASLARATSSPDAVAAVGRVLPHAARALAGAGLPLDPRGAEDALRSAVVDEDDQRLFRAIDATLESLAEGPAVVEIEARLGWSRRTVSRRARELHARYGIHGIGGESWRAVRDFYRVLVGTIFASHPDVTTRALAAVLGYASPDALCHAFANAGVPSPGAVKKFASPRG